MKQSKSKRHRTASIGLAWLLALLLLLPQPGYAAETSQEDPGESAPASEAAPAPEAAPSQDPPPATEESLRLSVVSTSTGANDEQGLRAYVEANQIKKGSDFSIRVTVKNPTSQLISSPLVRLELPNNAPYAPKETEMTAAISLAAGEEVTISFPMVAKENLQKGTYPVELVLEKASMNGKAAAESVLRWKTSFQLVQKTTELPPEQNALVQRLLTAWKEGRVKIVEASGNDDPPVPKTPADEPKTPNIVGGVPTDDGAAGGGFIAAGDPGLSGGGFSGGGEGGSANVKNKPKLIISNFSLEPQMAKAGDPFKLNLTFTNTNEDKNVYNIKITLNGGESGTTAEGKPQQGSVFTPVNSSNTFYIGKIAAQESAAKQITLRTIPNATAQSYTVKVNFEYEDSEGNQFTAEESIGIPVVQQAKVLIGEFQPMQGAIGQPIPLELDFYNTGKDTLTTFMVTLEGEDFEAEERRQFVGNFAPGASDRFSSTITATKPGQIAGKLVFTYEDSTGEAQRVEKPFTVQVVEMSMSEGEGMYDPETGLKIDPQTGLPIDPQTGLPIQKAAWWQNPILWVLLLAVVILGVVLFLRRRKKKKEQEDLLIDLDEES